MAEEIRCSCSEDRRNWLLTCNYAIAAAKILCVFPIYVVNNPWRLCLAASPDRLMYERLGISPVCFASTMSG